ncbi:hypothetical protein [Streptomyces phaeofaciens]|uniref:hypothetical protein n=1 Tax=Streptomyces phaeofaciens TaxID=68254 RepID=UPI00369FC236
MTQAAGAVDARPGGSTVLVLPLPTELPFTVAHLGDRLTEAQRRLTVPYAAVMGDAPTAADNRPALPAAIGGDLGQGVAVEAEPPAGSCVHDRFFRVRRARGDGAALLAAALLVSDLLVLDDLARNGSTLDEDPDNLLLGATAFLTGELPQALKDVRWAPADQVSAAEERWLVGHQRFFVMLQLLIVALQELGESAATPHEETAVHTFGWICRSTAASMRYAADFPPELYGGVRDTMTPPTVNAGFSGLQTRDHHALVNCMRQAGRDGVIDRLNPVAATAVHAAVQHLYDAHVWVCARFGGTSEPSLLMAQTDQATRKPPESGVVAAARLARQRLDYLTPADPR